MANGSDERLSLVSVDGLIDVTREAQERSGGWKSIEGRPSSLCGSTLGLVFLYPGEYWEFDVPPGDGNFATLIRCKLVYGNDETVYSHPFPGNHAEAGAGSSRAPTSDVQ